MIKYHKQHIAKTLFGLEDVLAAELEELGASNIKKMKRAVSFEGDKELIYKVNLWSRTALRVLVPVWGDFAKTESELYQLVYNIKWEEIIANDKTFAVDCVLFSKFFNHSKFCALKTKDAIVDRLRNITGDRPSVDTDTPDYRINVQIAEDRINISLDSSDRPLHMRGYREESNEAPINEVLAAGLIALSGWDGSTPLIDPMTGSGTIIIEAAMKAKNIAPGLTRSYFGFENWKDFDEDLWEKLRAEARNKIIDFDGVILGKDKNMRNVRLAERNAKTAKVADIIKFERQDFFKSKGEEPSTLIFNPPYDERIKLDDDAFYDKISDTLKDNYKGSKAWIISSYLEGLEDIEIEPSTSVKLFNGSLECNYNCYEIGS